MGTYGSVGAPGRQRPGATRHSARSTGSTRAPLGLCLPGGASFPPTPVEFTHFASWRCHETGAGRGMHNPNGTSVLEHALQIATLARPLVEAIQRKDRDLASQVRRAVGSIALNAAEGRGAAAGKRGGTSTEHRVTLRSAPLTESTSWA